LGSELAHDALSRNLAFEKAAGGPNSFWGEELLVVLESIPEQALSKGDQATSSSTNGLMAAARSRLVWS